MTERYIPRLLEELTPEWLTTALRESKTLESARVIDAKSELLGDGEGFIGVVARLNLEYDVSEPGAPKTLIAKLPTPVEDNRVMGELMGAYEREIRFYETLADRVPCRTPEIYYSAFDTDAISARQDSFITYVDRIIPRALIIPTMNIAKRQAAQKKRRYVLLLEDLSPGIPGNQVAGGSLEQFAQVLRAAANTHAAFWRDESLPKHSWLARQDATPRMRHGMYLDSRPDFARRYKHHASLRLDELLAWLDRYGAKLSRHLHGNAPTTLIHCDFRFDNLIFDARENRDPVIVFDWQLVGYGAAAYDIAYLVSGAMPSDVDAAEEDALLADYHERLCANGVSDYSFAEFSKDYERGLVMVLQILATTKEMEMGEDRGADLIDVWLERTLARLQRIDLDQLL